MKKQNCYGCRALSPGDMRSVWFRRYPCILGYKVDIVDKYPGTGLEPEPVPVNVCPKPRTHKALHELQGENRET